ncbi:copper transport protein [Stackebrandtia albiflava]|uniref:Copper transport protein n=1 Tax=Stackebrandtia albiflava TaxID=406432 RepID=A0A562V4E6_9ACTN|nr:copper resistance protein CopC [Stackebrandtia albiflava]TWJ12769.1 copper transport protein [Stackebrandtia albiflava]
MTPTPVVRARTLLPLSLLTGLLLVLLAGTPAHAHATVVSTSPAADEIVATAPSEIVVEFSEQVSVVAAETGVIAPDGERADAEPARSEGNVLTYRLRDDLPRGTYLVSYRVISADGHPVPGGYTFSIGERSATPDSDALDVEADPLVGALVLVNRYLGYAGLALVLGPGLLLVAARGRGSAFPPPRGPRLLATTGLATVAVTAVIGLYLQAPYTAGAGLFDVSGDDIGMVVQSRYGVAAMARLLAVLIAIPLLYRAIRPDAGTADRVLPGFAAVAMALTWPMSGHATTSPAPPLTVLTDTVHVAAMGMWVGGLVTMAVYLFRRHRLRELEDFLPKWSIWATWLVAALAVAGVAQAVIEIGTVTALLDTDYGRLVLVKVGLFAVLLAAAFLARRTVARAEHSDTTTRIRRLVTVELAVAAVILACSALLVQTVPARVAAETGEGVTDEGRLYSVKLTDELFTLQFEIEPVAVGDNTAHLYLFTPEGEPLEPLEWSATYGRLDADIAPVGIGLALLSPNHVQADVALPTAGQWEFTFTIRVGELDRATVSTVVTVM